MYDSTSRRRSKNSSAAHLADHLDRGQRGEEQVPVEQVVAARPRRCARTRPRGDPSRSHPRRRASRAFARRAWPAPPVPSTHSILRRSHALALCAPGPSRHVAADAVMRHAAVTTAASRCATSTASSFAGAYERLRRAVRQLNEVLQRRHERADVLLLRCADDEFQNLTACSFPNGCCEIFTSNRRIQSCAACFPPTRFRMSCETLEVSAAGFRFQERRDATEHVAVLHRVQLLREPRRFRGFGKCLASAANSA